MESHPTWQPQDAATPAETTAEDVPTAEDGLLLEFPLQERHYQIISTFMAEHQLDPSRDDSKTSTNRLPVLRVFQRLAGWLRTRWAQPEATP